MTDGDIHNRDGKIRNTVDRIEERKWERTDRYVVQEAAEKEGDELVVTSMGPGRSHTRICPTDYPQIDEELLNEILELEQNEEVEIRMHRDPKDPDLYIIEDIHYD